MDFDLSAVMRFDGSDATAGANQVASSLDEIAKAEGRAAKGARDLNSASTAGARGQSELAKATAGANATVYGMGQAANSATTATAGLTSATAKQSREAMALAQSQIKAAQASSSLAQAQKRASAEASRAAFGTRNLGQQVGDFATQVSMGGGIVQAFSAQVGQAGYAMSEMGGKMGAVGRFMTGPWGIALTVAGLVLAPLVSKLIEGGDAADDMADKLAKAASAADSFGNAQSLIGKVIDLTTGKLKTQNQVLIQSIRLQAQAGLLAAAKEQQDASRRLSTAGSASVVDNVSAFFSRGGGSSPSDRLAALRGSTAAIQRELDAYSRAVNNPKASTEQLDQALTSVLNRLDKLGPLAKVAGKDVMTLKQEVLALGTARNDRSSYQMALDALEGRGVDPMLKPYSSKGGPKPKPAPKPKSTAALDEFGRDAADKIAGIIGQFGDTPALVERTNAKIRELDDLVDDLNRKKPKGFEEMVKQAEAAKTVVRDGLQKPYLDFIDDQKRGLEIQALINSGRVDEANALRTVQQLQATMGPLSLEQRDAILATVQAIKAQQRESDILREKNQKYLDALAQVKGAFQGLVTGGVDDIKNFPKRLLDAFTELKGKQLFEKLFGSVFRDLEDQINGTNVVKDASDKMAKAVDKASDSIAKLGEAAARATGAVGGDPIPGSGGIGSVTDTSAANLFKSALAGLGLASAGASAGNDQGADIVVTGQRYSRDPGEFMRQALATISGKVASGFTSPENAKMIGDKIGKLAGKGLEGAATGTLTNQFLKPLGKALGVKTSQTGAQLGGAIGNMTGIPGGDIIGSVIGSVVGGLFKKTKSGAANITSVDGAATTSGNSNAYKAAAGAAASSIQAGLQQIAEQLGGDLGSFNVTIGQRHGDWRVRTGAGSLKVKKGAKEFDDDAEGAVAYAMQLAITQGAITGLSDAMQKALRSSGDINAALSEALKVKDVEALIGGLGSSLRSVFDEFDATAKERVRVAKKYGLDLVAVEKINAEQRAQILEETLNSRIGGLTSFLDDLKFGGGFEGSASERRAALLEEIARVTKDAEAGKAGAADALAQLFAQLVNTSKEAYGTGGSEYANDRNLALTEVQRIIQMETDRVNAAAQVTAKQTEAIVAGNTLTSETNDLLAVVNANLNGILGVLAGTPGAGTINTAMTAR